MAVHWRFSLKLLLRVMLGMFVVFRDHRQKTFVCSYNRWSIIRSLKRVTGTCNNELPGDLITVHNRGKYFYIVKECPRFKTTKRYVFPGGIDFPKNLSLVLVKHNKQTTYIFDLSEASAFLWT